MQKLMGRRRVVDITLDIVFFVWLLSILLTGHLVPAPLRDLLGGNAPIAASVDDGPNDALAPKDET